MGRFTEKNEQRILLTAFAFSGAAALIYEVAWTRALSLILGSTVYALSTMLATFMAGLALGAYLGGKLADKGKNLLFYFGIFELGIGIAGFAIVPIIYSLPPVYFSLYKSFHLNPTVYFVMQFLFVAALMLVPTTLMGATFPVVSKRITRNMEELGRKVGDAYSVNTLGAILGSLSAGFLLIPLVGIKWASFTAGAVNILIASLLLLLSRRLGRIAVIPILLIPLGAVLLTSKVSMKDPFSNFYMAARYQDTGHMRERMRLYTKLMEKDYAEGTVTAYRYRGSHLIIQHGGKMEGTGPTDVENAVLLALLPASAMTRPPQNMLVIGLGAGVTAWAGKKTAEDVSVVEINPGVIKAVSAYGPPGLLEGVKIYTDDARRMLSLSGDSFDIITSEPSVPSEEASANLFAREFYELSASRLKPGGVFCQWFPGWKLTEQDFNVALKTFASVFEHVQVWRVYTSNSDILVTGSMQPLPAPEEVVRRVVEAGASLRPFVELSPEPVEVMMTPMQVNIIRSIPGIPVHTYDKPYLEFAVAKNFLFGLEFRKLRN